ncbi:MAG: TIGR04013 family B12-binding domain/radical SAM domain-containing protein [Candidatus Eisenbacteria bacterium]
MKPKLRFTFVADRLNRTATASLIAALEDRIEERGISLRVVRPAEARKLDFDSPHVATEWVCMSSMTEGMLHTSKTLAHMRRSGAFRSICGGPHPTADPVGTLAAGFDYCCVGEGEEVIRAIADGAIADGVVGPHAERVLRGPGPTELSDFPPLPRRFTFRAHLEIGRGCRWRCTYCQTPRIFGHRERFRTPAAIEEIVSIYARRGMKDIRLLLPNALGYRSEAPAVPNCEALEELLRRASLAADGGRIFLGSFPSEIRPDYVTPEAVAVLKKYVSNRKLVIGGQSGSERILDLVARGHTVEAIERASRVVAAAGLEPAVDLVLGFPEEESEDRQATFALMERLRRVGATFNLHFFMPLPGTPLAGTLPRFLSESEHALLDRLAQEGLVRGRWRHQEELARQWSSDRGETSPK